MRKLFIVLLSAAMFLSGQAWSVASAKTDAQVSKAAKSKKCTFPKSKRRAPVWVCNVNVNGLVLTAVGSAPKSKAGLAHMEQMAAADARAQLVRKSLGPTHMKTATGEGSASKEAAGDDLATKIGNESLMGTKIMKRVFAPNGTLYVLMGLDETDAQKLREAINAGE